MRVESCLGWGIDTSLMQVFIKKERLEHVRICLTPYAEAKTGTDIFVSQTTFDSIVGVIGFLRQVILCLVGPHKWLIETQTECRRLGPRAQVRIGKREIWTCKWILFYLQKWSGVTSIYRAVWLGPHLHIFSDAGNPKAQSGVIWGMGAYCTESGEYISQPWFLNTECSPEH